MAESEEHNVENSVADDQNDIKDNVDAVTPSKKRRLRAPSETVRERAVKAQEAAADPKVTKKRLVFRGFTLPLRLIGRGLTWLAHKPPLRPLGHGLRWFFTRRPMKFLGKILGFNYVAGSIREVRMVTWPTFRQSIRLTRAVIIFSIIFGSLIAGVDYGLGKVFKHIILK